MSNPETTKPGSLGAGRIAKSLTSATSGSDSTGRSASTIAADEVRVLTTAEYKQASLSLAESFANDHVARYFLDTPARSEWSEQRKWQLHCDIIEYIVYQHLLKGLVTAVGPDYSCVALWCTPDSGNPNSWLTLCRSGIWRLAYKLDREARIRFFKEFWPLLGDTKQATLGSRADESYYLVYIGTHPSARGKGYARKNIEFITSRADREGKPCYLESSEEINVKIYRKLGFEVDRQIFLTRGEERITLDIMVREPMKSDVNKKRKVYMRSCGSP